MQDVHVWNALPLRPLLLWCSHHYLHQNLSSVLTFPAHSRNYLRGLELNHDGLRVPECSYGCSARMATSQLLPDLVLTICCEELLAIADAVELRNISHWAAHLIAGDFLQV